MKLQTQFKTNLCLACFVKTGFVALILISSLLQKSFSAQSISELPAVNAIEARIEQVKNDTSMDEAQKSQAISQLQLALKRRETALELNRQAQSYVEAYANAAKQQKAFDNKAASLKSTTLHSSVQRASLAKLEPMVAKNDAELAALRKQLAQVNADIKNEKAFDIQVALDEARQAVQLQSVEPASTQMNDVSRILQQVTLYLQQSKIENLEQRLLSRNARLSLWESEQKLLNKQITILENTLDQIRALVTNHRQSDVNKILSTVKSSLESQEGQPAVILDLAKKNIELAEELNKLVSDQDKVIEEKEIAATGAQKMQQKFTSLTEQLAITQLGSSPEFGAALRNQRNQITDESRSRRTLQLNKVALTQSRLAQFRIDALREVDQASEVKKLLAKFTSDTGQPATEEQQQAILNLLSIRDNVLEKLSTAYWNYISNLTSLTVQSGTLISLNRQYAELLDQQLLWMPSSPTLGTTSITKLDDSVLWLTNPKTWRNLYEAASLKTQILELFILSLVLILSLLLYRRAKMLEVLAAMTGRVGKVNKDKIGLTVVALVISLLLALPGPLVLLFAAFLVTNTTAFSTALGEALYYGAIFYFTLNFVLQSARDDGLLVLHLKWSHYIVGALRRNLPWFIAIIIPAIILVSLIENHASSETRDSLGRLIFIVQTITMAIFARLIFPPARATLWSDRHKETLDLSELLYRNSRFILTVLVPLFLVGFSIYGYHYSAVQLETYLLNSALVILAGNLSFCFALRLFAINERQLALEKLRAQRAAAAAAKLASEEDDEEPEDYSPSAIDLQEIDLQTISKQTRTLLKLVFTVAVGIALWQVWTEIFPAFHPLVNVELWQVQEMRNGVANTLSITLWDLLLSIVTLVITYLATRNISGLLDVALLSRVSLQPGSSYAIATVAQYIIVIVGTVIALQGLGAQWSKLQWLIAALSVGLGFGLQEMVANFVSGIIILFERPFRIGDTVTVGDQWGTVTKIRMRATTIIDWDRRETIVPNKTFIQEKLTNWTLTDAITRRKIDVGVAYGSDIDLVEKLLLKIAHENPKVLDEPASEAFFVSFGDSCLNFCLRVFVRGHREHAAVAHELHKAIVNEFRENGIEIAYPQRDLHLDSKPININLIDPNKAKRSDERDN